MDRKPNKPCKWCGSMAHYPYACYQNPKRKLKSLKRSPIKKIGKTTKQWFITRATWFKKNPPDENGYWYCYLQIHEWCPVKLDSKTVTLDHVISRTRDRSQVFNQDNLKPACIHCNKEKGSRSVEEVMASKGRRVLQTEPYIDE